MATRPQQRSNLQPERVEDDDHGQGRDSVAADRDESDGVDNDLSDEERAALDGMRTGETPRDGADGAGDGEGDDDGAGDADDGADADDDADGVGAGDRQAPPRERGQGARDDRGGEGDQSQQRTPRTINYGRHQREIAKREQRLTELEGLLNTEREQRTRLDERTRVLLEAINQRQAPAAQQEPAQQREPEDPEPDREADPIGHLEWKNRKLEGQVQRLLEGREQDQQQRQQQTEEERELGEYMAEVQAAAQSNPLVADAFVALRESRYAELGSIYAGIDVNDPEQVKVLTPQQQVRLSRQIQDAFAREQRMVFQAARESKRPIGQTILMLAKARGFAAQQRQQQDQDLDDGADDGQQQQQPSRRQQNGGGRQPVPQSQRAPQRPQAQRAPSVSDEIENIRQAAGASKSLSDAGGSPGGALDMQRLVDMDDDEFEEVLAGLTPNKLARVMGK